MTNESITTLQGHAIWTELTPKQQRCLESILRGSDRVSAVAASYNCKNHEQARVMSYAILSAPRIIQALAIARNEDPERAVFMHQLGRAAKNPKTTPSQLNAMRLYAAMKGFLPSEPADDGQHRFKVGDVVQQIDPETGKPYKFIIEAREIE